MSLMFTWYAMFIHCIHLELRYVSAQYIFVMKMYKHSIDKGLQFVWNYEKLINRYINIVLSTRF